MQIVGIGIDLVNVARIEKAAQSERFCQKIFTTAELEYCKSRGKQMYQSLAARWAAKEAIIKACGQVFNGATWLDAEVENNDNGKPSLLISGRLDEIFSTIGVKSTMVSLSHTREHAIAQVMLLGD